MKKYLAFLFLFMLALCAPLSAHAAPSPAESDAALLTNINELRITQRLDVLEGDKELLGLAQIRAAEVLEFWSHDRPNGGDGCGLVLDEVPGTIWAGENLARLNWYPDNYENEIFKMLCDSQSHYNNFVYSGFKKCGICTLQGEDKTVTVILFAG